MTLIRTQHPSGIYIDSYSREPGEYADLARRAERRDTEDCVPVVTVATTLRKAMAEHSMYGKELAEIVGVAPSLVSKWLHGSTTPQHDVLRKVAETLGLDYWTMRKLSGRDPVAIHSDADEHYIGASEAARSWNGSRAREKGAAS